MDHQDLDELVRCCQQEDAQYRLYGQSDSECSLKLFRLALEEECEGARERLYQHYEPRLRSWFYAHTLSYYLREYQDDIINEAFERLYVQHQKKSLKIDKLSEILTYLHRCLCTAIMIWKRMKDKERFTVGTLDDLIDIPAPDPIDQLLGKLTAEEIWQQVVQCTDNACEERVIYQWLVRGESAPEIVRLLPADKLTGPKVYQIAEKVLRRYRKRYPDPKCRDSLEGQDSSDN